MNSNTPNAHFLAGEYPQSPAGRAVFQVIPVPFEGTVSYGKGTAGGPAAILAASEQLEPFDGYSRPGDAGIHTWPAVACNAQPEQVLPRVRNAVASALAAHKAEPVPVILGGEHSITAPAVEAVAAATPSEPLGLIQIDAHADLRKTYEGTHFSHACVVRRVHEEFGIPVIQLGVRALCEEELAYRELHGSASNRSLHWHDARKLVSSRRTRFEIPDHFPRRVYLTLDVDGLDPSLCPATGTPVPGGLEWYQTLDLIAWIVASRHLVAFDVVELAPISGFHAADFAVTELTYRIMGMISRSRSERNNR